MMKPRHHSMWPVVVLLIVVTIPAGFTVRVGQAAGVTVVSRSLTSTSTCTLSALSAASTVAVDTFVNQASATANSGTANTMEVRSSNNANRRVYLRFDLTACSPALPAGAIVTSSNLRLFVTTVPAVCRTYNIYRVASSWVEATVTWNNQPFGTTINNPASGQTASITVGAAPCQNTAANTYVNGWDVTTDVQAFLAGPATNFGWMIRDSVEGSATARAAIYSTKNAANIPRSPQLIVNYTVG